MPYETPSGEGGDATLAEASVSESPADDAPPQESSGTQEQSPDVFEPAGTSDIFAGLESIRRTKKRTKSSAGPRNDITIDATADRPHPEEKEPRPVELGVEGDARFPLRPGASESIYEPHRTLVQKAGDFPEVDASTSPDLPNEGDLPEIPVEMPGDPVADPQYSAWLLGISLSGALLGGEITSPRESIEAQFETAQRAASLLGLRPLEFPLVNASAEGSTEHLSMAISAGQGVSRDLASKHGGHVVALFELGFKSNLLRTDYVQRAQLADATREALRSSAVKSKLPPDLWRQALEAPLEDAQASLATRTATSLQEAVSRFLSAQLEEPLVPPEN